MDVVTLQLADRLQLHDAAAMRAPHQQQHRLTDDDLGEVCSPLFTALPSRTTSLQLLLYYAAAL